MHHGPQQENAPGDAGTSAADRIASLERRVDQLEQALLALIEEGIEDDEAPTFDLNGGVVPPMRKDIQTL